LASEYLGSVPGEEFGLGEGTLAVWGGEGGSVEGEEQLVDFAVAV
jgi:hypothetical protein